MTHSHRSDTPQRVGFIGLGKMGNLMAANLLQAGFALVVHDLRRDSATALLDSGAAWADSPAGVARAAGIVCTSLPGPKEMEEVAYRPGGLRANPLGDTQTGLGLRHHSDRAKRGPVREHAS